MKVKELIEQLKSYDPELEVYTSYSQCHCVTTTQSLIPFGIRETDVWDDERGGFEFYPENWPHGYEKSKRAIVISDPLCAVVDWLDV